MTIPRPGASTIKNLTKLPLILVGMLAFALGNHILGVLILISLVGDCGLSAGVYIRLHGICLWPRLGHVAKLIVEI